MASITLSGATEMMIVVCVFLVCAGFIFGELNPGYAKSFTIGAYQVAVNKTISDLAGYQATAQSQIETGDVSLISYAGLVLQTSWSLFRTLIGIIWNSITFGYVEMAMQALGIPSPIPLIARMVLTIALVFVVGKLFFRVKT